MNFIQAVVVGIVQGVGEFLPISSSAHLIFIPWLFGWEDHGMTVDVGLHLGTLFAVLVYYHKVWIDMILSLVKPNAANAPSRSLFRLLVIATIPGALIGLVADKYVETIFRSPLLIACTLSFMGLVLWYIDRRSHNNQRSISDLKWKDALIVGIAQCCSVVPGFSRSGTTISMSLFLGLRRADAARFSFFLSAPIVMGAVVLKLPKLIAVSHELGTPFYTAVITSALIGFASIHGLILLLQKRSYAAFAVYRVAISMVILAVYFYRTRGY
jgi:undecaprenyl-diphosphatase